jgi:hypothetical protein
MPDEVLARYPLRTPRGYLAVLVLLIALGVGAVVVLMMWLASPYHGMGGMLGAMLALLAATPVWYILSTRAYRIAGGRGELALLADRLEVRDGRGGTAAFPLASLQLVARPQVVQLRAWGLIPLGERRAGTLIELRAGAQRVVLSSKLLDDEDHLPGLVEDVALARGGQPPLGPRLPAPPKPVAVGPDGYDYEAELDRELRRYDDA